MWHQCAQKKKKKSKTKPSWVTDRTFRQHVGKIEDCSSSRPSFILFSRGTGSTSAPALRSTVSSVSYHVLSEKQWHTIIISLREKKVSVLSCSRLVRYSQIHCRPCYSGHIYPHKPLAGMLWRKETYHLHSPALALPWALFADVSRFPVVLHCVR